MSIFSRLLVPPVMRRGQSQGSGGGRARGGGRASGAGKAAGESTADRGVRARARELARPGRGFAAARAAAKKARRPAGGAGHAVYFIERSVTTLLPSGKKKARKTTREWRHGKCQVKHRSAAAAARCRNP